MNGIVHTLIVCEIKVLGLKKANFVYLDFFLDETLVDMHASAFLCLLLLPFSHGVCVILPVSIDSMLFLEKMCYP